MTIAAGQDLAQGDHDGRTAIATFEALTNVTPAGWATLKIYISVDVAAAAGSVEAVAVLEQVGESVEDDGFRGYSRFSKAAVPEP